jgi:hypothetical protein
MMGDYEERKRRLDDVEKKARSRVQKRIEAGGTLRTMEIEWTRIVRECHPRAVAELFSPIERERMKALVDFYGKDQVLQLMAFAARNWSEWRKMDDFILKKLHETPLFTDFYMARRVIGAKWASIMSQKDQRRAEWEKIKAEREEAQRLTEQNCDAGLTMIRDVMAKLKEKGYDFIPKKGENGRLNESN